MAGDLTRDVHIFPDAAVLAETAASAVATLAAAAVAARGRFTLVLAGGSTPRALYRRLAGPWSEHMPWAETHLFWGDERYVPHDDPRNNYHMAREALLDHVPVPESQIHPMPTAPSDPAEAATAYETVLRAYYGDAPPRFDLVLLGMGADGHTASLFPGTPAVEEQTRLVVPGRAPVEPHTRLTLTFPVLDAARAVLFLVTGADKGPALRCALASAPNIAACPAGAVRPADGTVTWYLDAAAAPS